MDTKYLFIFGILFLGIIGCEKKKPVSPAFTLISSESTGIDFNNLIIENDTLNYFTYPYAYMGGGVAIGDINNDGLQDIYFTGNNTPNKLYLNKGNFSFEDITESAGATGDQRWYTGVSMVDINADGWLDIYLCVSGIFRTTVNQLLINNGDNTFTESAETYGLNDSVPSTQATYLDFDRDGHLDVFVANYTQGSVSMGNHFYRDMMETNYPYHSGHLFHNQQDGTFKDITTEAGLQSFSLTLGATAVDFNNDGWTDLYLSNDFNIPDYLYINNGDGTFREVLKETTGHIAMFGMGLDAGDINNDGLPDLIQMDMTPSDHYRSKTNMASMSPRGFYEGVEMGFHYQYMQNTLQLNNGSDHLGNPQFSDIARLTGLATTDWSWGPLFADFDNDGLKDILVTNGILRDVNNNDVLQSFNSKHFFKSSNDYTKLPSTPIPNYIFRNNGNLSFQDKSEEWGLTEKGFSNGVAYGDLDNDGDLDIVINNINSPASIYENKVAGGNNYLKVNLQGPDTNPMGFGAKVYVKAGTLHQFQEHFTSRGYQSSVEPLLHFGLNDLNSIEEVKVVWPDGSHTLSAELTVNQSITLAYEDRTTVEPASADADKFQLVNHSGLDFQHLEDKFDDYAREPLLPHRNSNLGPGAAIGDVDGNGLDDIFIGNARASKSQLYLQSKPGKFEKKTGPWDENIQSENTGARFHDIDGDGDLDLLTVNGGNDIRTKDEDLLPVIYIYNDGEFLQVATPSIRISGKVILPMDYDNDGDTDLFFGGRIIPGGYPSPPSSYLLENKGGKNGEIRYELADLPPSLGQVGLITAAVWDDFDGDNQNELILTGEWMGIEVFSMKNGSIERVTNKYEMGQYIGWWRSLEALDVDNDGDLDLVAGNLGLNYKYKATKDKPFSIYASDFDENGTQDIVLSYEKKGKKLPLRGRECSSGQVPAIKIRYETFESFASASLEDIYGEYMLDNALQYHATNFEHAWFENKNGKFIKNELPVLSQISSIEVIRKFDYNGDEFADLIVAGNLYEAEVETTRNDAGLGLILVGNGSGFDAIPVNDSGLMVRGEVRDIAEVNQGLFVFILNNDSVQVWTKSGN